MTRPRARESAALREGGYLVVVAVLTAAVISVGLHRYVGGSIADLRGFRQGAELMRHGHSEYGAFLYLYPPFGAVPAELLLLGSRPTIVRWSGVLQIVLPVLAGLAAARVVHRRWSLPVGLISALIMLEGETYRYTLPSHNLSILLILPAALAGWWTVRNHDAWSASLIAVTVCIEPRLVLLMALPLLRRRWRAFAVSIALSAVLTAIGVVLNKGIVGLHAKAHLVLGGSTLVGKLRYANDALQSVGIVHSDLHTVTQVLRALFVLGMVGVLIRWVRHPGTGVVETLGMAGALMMILPVVGSLSELEYGLVALPFCVVLVFMTEAPVLVRSLNLLSVVGLATWPLSFGLTDGHTERQLFYGVAQAVTLLAMLVTAVATDLPGWLGARSSIGAPSVQVPGRAETRPPLRWAAPARSGAPTA